MRQGEKPFFSRGKQGKGFAFPKESEYRRRKNRSIFPSAKRLLVVNSIESRYEETLLSEEKKGFRTFPRNTFNNRIIKTLRFLLCDG